MQAQNWPKACRSEPASLAMSLLYATLKILFLRSNKISQLRSQGIVHHIDAAILASLLERCGYAARGFDWSCHAVPCRAGFAVPSRAVPRWACGSFASALCVGALVCRVGKTIEEGDDAFDALVPWCGPRLLELSHQAAGVCCRKQQPRCSLMTAWPD